MTLPEAVREARERDIYITSEKLEGFFAILPTNTVQGFIAITADGVYPGGHAVQSHDLIFFKSL